MSAHSIFCIVDPTTNVQPALDRASLLAEGRDAAVHAHLCLAPAVGKPSDERERLQAEERRSREAWLEEMVQPLRDRGLAVTVQVETQEDWRAALAPAARRHGADLILKSTYRHSAVRRHLLKTADWLLLRSAHCPVLFAKADHVERLERVLAAVNIRDEDPAHQRLTDDVLERARALADLAGAELHAVNSYNGSLNRVSPQELAKRVGIDRRRCHVGDMRPETLIAETAQQIGAPIVVVGTVARSGLAGLIVGNTAERILDSVDEDLLTVVHGVQQSMASGVAA